MLWLAIRSKGGGDGFVGEERLYSRGEHTTSGSHLASESLPPPLQFIFFFFA